MEDAVIVCPDLVCPLDVCAVDEAEDADAGRGQQPHARVRRLTLREEWLEDVQSERQRLDQKQDAVFLQNKVPKYKVFL